ncbi:MAG: 4Fe-4S dicluster domain-containing protein [Planctomycetes bacterium]|nr:4Fe-4S dicluster domain-containing protein [Planctomycetota bacterium]
MFRLDFFLPFLARPRKGEAPRAPGRLARVARVVLPAALFSDPAAAKPGLVRRALKKIGPITAYSPLRRAVQALCFVLFLVLFFHVCWPYSAQPGGKLELDSGAWPAHYAIDLDAKEWTEAELFLVLDPLVALSTAVAAKAWVWSLAWAGGILLICVLFPRGFCGYLCPLGTLIDFFDWAIGNRVQRFKIEGDGWWVHFKYYLLAGIFLAGFFGVLLSGIFAAIPVITRGFLFIFGLLQMGLLRGWHQVPPLNAGHYVSIALFLGVLGLGLLRKRFWCRYVCPSGAVFSVFNRFRASERKVESSCIHCDKCIEVCPFDAIKADFTTRTPDCTLCQTCGGVCPTHSIKFVERWNVQDLKPQNDPPTMEVPLSRRNFLYGALGSLAAVSGMRNVFGADLGSSNAFLPVRPPGSVPEPEFLQLCIRCGECFKACPNNVLQPLGFEQGLEGLWTPQVVADWSGCETSCNNCGQVCPTGAIHALSLEEKKVARMGLAIVNRETCLPWAGKEACQLCFDECNAAGYRAIEFQNVGTQVDEEGLPIDGSGFLAPVVKPELCVGCGLCQSRCHHAVVQLKKLEESAIVVEAGAGKEDRFMQGNYLELRAQEAAERRRKQEEFEKAHGAAGDGYLPEFLK